MTKATRILNEYHIKELILKGNPQYENFYKEELIEFCKISKHEIDRLNNIIDTMLEFSFFKEECPLNFGFGDEREEKAQDVFYDDDYCEQNCNDIYKKCWLKYFEKLQELKDSD